MYRVKTYIWYQSFFGFQGMPLLLRGFARTCDRHCLVGDLRDLFLWWKKMASNGKIKIKKFNGHNFELWKLKMEDLLVDKYQWIMVDPGTKLTMMSGEY